MELNPPKIEEKAISVRKQHKHLGVVLSWSDDLYWSAQNTQVIAVGKRKAGFRIIRYMAKIKRLPTDLVSKRYTTYVRPVLEYASPVWHGIIEIAKPSSGAGASTMDNAKERTFLSKSNGHLSLSLSLSLSLALSWRRSIAATCLLHQLS